jgi:uncharacterized membrane protein
MLMVTVVYFLHVLLAFTAIAFLVVPGLILEMAARTKDVPFIRRLFRLASFHGRVGGMIALLTAIVGFIVAWRVGIPLNAGWMIAAYVVFVVVVVVLGMGYHARREMRIAALAEVSPDDAPSPELAAAIDDPLAVPIFWASGILWILLIWLMVARPF